MPNYITHGLVHKKDLVKKEWVNKQAVKILREKTDLPEMARTSAAIDHSHERKFESALPLRKAEVC